MEQRLPRTKIAQHKGPNGNVVRGRNAEASDGRWKEQGDDAKNVNISTTLCFCIFNSVVHSRVSDARYARKCR